MSEQMRAAWGRQTDTELLRAYFVEELSPYGREVVSELVAEKVGSIAEYVAGFAAQQGEVVERLRVRACHVNHDHPSMKGEVVLTDKGLGFIPRGRDGDEDSWQPKGLLGLATMAIWKVQQTGLPVDDLSRAEHPVPLMAHVAPSAVWLPHESYDTLIWSATSGEVVRAGERLLSFRTRMDCQAVVRTWAHRHGVRVQHGGAALDL
jgi:hypothetical protein